jgi:Fe-S-cluster-containing hydrogenase component 2/thioredoxin reductase
LSAAAHAAELGLSHILLEAEPAAAHTIRRFQRGKHVMAEPAHVPLRSAFPFEAGTREQVLKTWENALRQGRIQLRTHAPVIGIAGRREQFTLTLAGGEMLEANHVILAIGVQGNIRKLGVDGENLPMVQYQLDDPDAFVDETIVVVGGGDAGVENALALMASNRVILMTRDGEFNRCNEKNLALLNEAAEDFMIETRVNCRVAQAVAIKEGGFSLMLDVLTPSGIEKIACHRLIARLGANPPRKLVESFGVSFPNDDLAALPQLSAQYESSVPGLYIVGALAGYPLIKQAINQGFEVVEHILGHAIEPADELLLKEKLAAIPGDANDDKLAFIRRQVPFLADLTTPQLRELLLVSHVLKPAEGAVIYQFNDYSSTFSLVVEGEAVARGAGVEQHHASGNFFGETGLISGRRRGETVTAGAQACLIEIPRRTMLNLLGENEALRHRLDSTALKRAVQAYLGFPLAEEELDGLAAATRSLTFASGDTLYREGDSADGLYLIRSGSVTISRQQKGKEVVQAFVTAGHTVGEMELISGRLRSHTVRAAVLSEVVQLEASALAGLMARNPALRQHLDERYLQQMRREAADEPDGSADIAMPRLRERSDGVFNFLMQQGVGEATNVLLIDYDLCIRCDACEDACADTHGGTSRLDREAGTTFANIHIPTSCRHCELPHCMKDCPPDAIHRSVHGEVYINDSCIGCGNCVENCPYDVIQLAQVQAGEQRRKPLFRFMLDLFMGRDDQPVLGPDAPKKAVKCDMCNNFIEGPVCIRACPTGAAQRVNPESLLS